MVFLASGNRLSTRSAQSWEFYQVFVFNISSVLSSVYTFVLLLLSLHNLRSRTCENFLPQFCIYFINVVLQKCDSDILVAYKGTNTGFQVLKYLLPIFHHKMYSKSTFNTASSLPLNWFKLSEELDLSIVKSDIIPSSLEIV